MIYIGYIISTAVLVVLTIKAAKYANLLEKNTRYSGAFLGGIVISAVTSTPELFTSIAAMGYTRPTLCLGDILGSNLFNLCILSVTMLFYVKKFCKGKVSKCYRNVLLLVLLVYLLIGLNYFGQIEGGIFHLSITSILIVVVYFFGAKYLSVADDVEADEDLLAYHASYKTDLDMKQVASRFAVICAGVVIFSVIVTVATVKIMGEVLLAEGLAGAILLGIATSIPEIVIVVTLFRMKNYNIAVGNIVGSNLFNLLILSVADIIYVNRGVYAAMDVETLQLLILGLVATLLEWALLKYKSKNTVIVSCTGIIICYILFLFI